MPPSGDTLRGLLGAISELCDRANDLGIHDGECVIPAGDGAPGSKVFSARGILGPHSY